MKRDLPIERKALYNLIRMQWIQEPDPKIERWQIENLRDLSLSELIGRLKEREIVLNQESFLAYADSFLTPEEMTDGLLDDREISHEESDEIFLIIFEIWRRLLPEKESLSIFCDHLDHLVWGYDSNTLLDHAEVEEAVIKLLKILQKSSDGGEDPIDVFEMVSSHLANDLESFIYDYIGDQIEENNFHFASELIEGFIDYATDLKWFDLLKARMISLTDREKALELILELVSESHSEPDLEFVFELMDVLVEIGNDSLFYPLVRTASHLLRIESDLQELLVLCLDYFQRQDRDKIAYEIDNLIHQRSSKNPMELISSQDKTLKKLLHLLKI